MPVIIVDWESAHCHGELWIAQHRLRHRIFVERLGWDLPAHQGLEYDAFDTPAAKYVVWADDQGEARGITRLVPTTRPYMVEQIWPDWLPAPLPRSKEIWEASRFGCDQLLSPSERRRVAFELIAGCQRFGVANGISAYLAVMPVWIFERVLAAAGCPLRMLAAPRMMDGATVGVAEVEVSPAVLARVEAKIAPVAARPPASEVASPAPLEELARARETQIVFAPFQRSSVSLGARAPRAPLLPAAERPADLHP